MGQSLMKLASGDEDKKANEIGPTIENYYDKYLASETQKDIMSSTAFYRAVCETVEAINKMLGSTQFRVPEKTTLEKAYNKHHQGKGKSLTKEEFEKIIQEVIKDTGVTGIGVKDILFYIFGVPATALLIKQRVVPKLIPNEILIPAVTSATVVVLAKLNKI